MDTINSLIKEYNKIKGVPKVIITDVDDNPLDKFNDIMRSWSTKILNKNRPLQYSVSNPIVLCDDVDDDKYLEASMIWNKVLGISLKRKPEEDDTGVTTEAIKVSIVVEKLTLRKDQVIKRRKLHVVDSEMKNIDRGILLINKDRAVLSVYNAGELDKIYKATWK